MALKPNWSVQQEIARRAEKESWVEFWEKLEPGKLIELKKIDIKKDSPGMYNLISNVLNNLRP